SLWSQLMGKAVTGPLKAEELEPIPMAHTTWADWKAKHENTLVLSTDTGYRRDYDRDPYAGYERKDRVMFPVSHKNDKYHMKETVVGIEIDGKFKAYPFSELEKTSGRIEDKFNGQKIVVHYDDKHKTATVTDPQGNEIHSTILYWFAWVAFHPDTQVFQAPKS
nr:DUF3179 domain-containing protein [candidate division KSB1 bacterium]NIR73062.1 DUF3179 domain-containing protein [candidate division KSB1 bacterium]NIS28303.1 DUF3179 domain-containing protein [candidate division KSB1 bacterium]NIT75172.1 DUF3179 domain-containing protein [candidate division KSB1 bacterium]NIU29009.1 DUF3179 domain-containing protein [candidate division KSB1 bacterium]